MKTNFLKLLLLTTIFNAANASETTPKYTTLSIEEINKSARYTTTYNDRMRFFATRSPEELKTTFNANANSLNNKVWQPTNPNYGQYAEVLENMENIGIIMQCITMNPNWNCDYNYRQQLNEFGINLFNYAYDCGEQIAETQNKGHQIPNKATREIFFNANQALGAMNDFNYTSNDKNQLN